MAEPNIVLSTEPNTFTYQGQKVIRWAFTQYMRHLFKGMKFLEDFKWVGDSPQERKLSKIHIWSEFPQKEVLYPQIVVGSTPLRLEQLSFEDISSWEMDDTGYYARYTGSHRYSVYFHFSSYGKDELEEIIDRVLILLGLSEVRNAVAKTYGIIIDVASGINTSALAQRDIPDTDKQEFNGTVEFFVQNQWEIIMPTTDVEVINSERVESEVI